MALHVLRFLWFARAQFPDHAALHFVGQLSGVEGRLHAVEHRDHIQERADEHAARRLHRSREVLDDLLITHYKPRVCSGVGLSVKPEAGA
jgi:hypothetical protein